MASITVSTTTEPPPAVTMVDTPVQSGLRPKLHGRAFYESIGSPKYIIAPMVDASEFVSRAIPD
jgi:tRNA-dihydrouridine synthase 1